MLFSPWSKTFFFTFFAFKDFLKWKKNIGKAAKPVKMNHTFYAKCQKYNICFTNITLWLKWLVSISSICYWWYVFQKDDVLHSLVDKANSTYRMNQQHISLVGVLSISLCFLYWQCFLVVISSWFCYDNGIFMLC